MKRVVLVTGSRDFPKAPEIEYRMRKYPAGTIFLHGDAQGADTICRLTVERDGRYGQCRVPYFGWLAKAGGPARNQFMLEILLGLSIQGFEVSVEAFPTPECRGTKDMVNKAKKAKLAIHIYGEDERDDKPYVR